MENEEIIALRNFMDKFDSLINVIIEQKERIARLERNQKVQKEFNAELISIIYKLDGNEVELIKTLNYWNNLIKLEDKK